ncbi:hypothetical protein [Geminocystis sp. NIES-3709]|uniref:hypothetical protein n=1 Tax=Geminocystis sp. NIES-3709 TaxID=1617448 RepID=UPI0005FC79BC|nr:hypothetical protein [Geminocystis sp. NIES-3709]BAQ64488.1 hypothetical protein GM3709_1253 [Geminocystis sp. NIES-3709]
MRPNTSILLENKAFLLFFLLKIIQQFKKFTNIDKLTELHNLKKVSSIDINKYKSSDTLFILGSGASIKELGEKQWELIQKHDSIGINFWLIHKFIPTYYMFELGKDLDRLNTFLKLINLKSDDYKNVPLIFKDIDNDLFDISKFPEQVKNNLYVPYKLAIPGFSQKSFTKSLKIINFLKLQNKQNLLLAKRASITEAISFGLKLKYKNIILCGVDLNTVEYFYEDKIYEEQNLPIPKKVQTGLIHKTANPNDPNYGDITINIILSMVNNYLLTPNEVNLFVGSKTSALYPMFPWYFENK